MIRAFFHDPDSWVLIVGLVVMGWCYWPRWRHEYRRWRQHRDWERSPL